MEWLAGDASRRAELEEAIARLTRDEGVEWLRRRADRRRIARVPLAGGRSCFVKHYVSSDRHATRDAWKERLGLATARREWRTFARLRAAGVSVPAPLAHVRLPSREHVLVTEWIAGVPLAEALADAAQRRPLLAALGALVRALHDAGWVHRDLHRENILVANGAPVLIDLQAARRSHGEAARLRDLGRLDHSLRRLLVRGDRVRLRAAALGLERPFDSESRERVRAVGRASLARARAHALSRSRRSLRAGRRFEDFEHAGGHGLVSRAFDAVTASALLASGSASPGFEVRRYRASLRDVWRGSPARRAWSIAHALEASDLGCVAPVAFVEWKRIGIPVRSALVVANELRTDACRIATREDLLARLRDAGFDTRALAASGIALCEGAARVTLPEQLRFPVRRP